jgi:hypothetical protein
MNDRELDLLVGELLHENKQLRRQRDEAVSLVASLRTILESHAEYILAVLKDRPEAIGSDAQSHGDKASY